MRGREEEGVEREGRRGMGKGREGKKEKRGGEGGRGRDGKEGREGCPLSEILNTPLAPLYYCNRQEVLTL